MGQRYYAIKALILLLVVELLGFLKLAVDVFIALDIPHLREHIVNVEMIFISVKEADIAISDENFAQNLVYIEC